MNIEKPEKGAAGAVTEYLKSAYPDISGFSPRNMRRMRDFYRMYENAPDIIGTSGSVDFIVDTWSP